MSNTVPRLKTDFLSAFQFPIGKEETPRSGEATNSDTIPTLFHLQKRRYSSVSVTGQSDIYESLDEEEELKLLTPPRDSKRKFSILNSPQSGFTSPISPISGLMSSPLSPRFTNIVSPLQIAIQQSMSANITPKDLHDLIIQILLEHEKTNKNNQEQINTYRNQIEKNEKSLNTHLQENQQLKISVTGLNKDVQFLKLQSEKFEVDHQNKILDMKNKLERKERDLSQMVALSQRLEHENIILHRIQELVCGKVDALVQQLEDKEVAVSYLEEVVNILRMLIEEKNRESYDKTEHVYNRLHDLCNQLILINGTSKGENENHQNDIHNKLKKEFDQGIHSLRDQLKKEMNDCVSTMYNNRVHGKQFIDANSCEQRVQLIQTKLEELRIQSEEQEKVLHQANDKLILELGKRMEEISDLQVNYGATNSLV